MGEERSTLQPLFLLCMVVRDEIRWEGKVSPLFISVVMGFQRFNSATGACGREEESGGQPSFDRDKRDWGLRGK